MKNKSFIKHFSNTLSLWHARMERGLHLETYISVSLDRENPGDFSRVSDALDAVPADNQNPVTIKIAPGVYYEKLTVNKPFVTLEGTGASNADTVLRYDDYANFIMEDGQKRGTFRSYSVLIDAHDVTLRNLTVENSSGDARTHGQAIALYADGDRLYVDACRILGQQDTLFTGPLPPKELEKNGFVGPKQFAPRTNGRQYYKNCYLCGNIDFIFGSATAFFENCTIASLCHDKADTAGGIQGYVTAASTPKGQDYGYVFYRCDFVSDECPPGTVYLGRPWREYAKTVFVECSFGEHVCKELIHNWGKVQAEETVYYAVYPEPTQDGGDGRAHFVHLLDVCGAAAYRRGRVLGAADGWMESI